MTGRVRVIRNPAHLLEGWYVICTHCPSEHNGAFPLRFEALFNGGERVLGWTPTWTAAQGYADQHAKAHLEHTCPTCGVVPRERLEVPA